MKLFFRLSSRGAPRDQLTAAALEDIYVLPAEAVQSEDHHFLVPRHRDEGCCRPGS